MVGAKQQNLLLIALVSLLTIHPSKKIASPASDKPDVDLPKILIPGEVFSIQPTEKVGLIFLNGKPLTKLEGRNILIGGISVNNWGRRKHALFQSPPTFSATFLNLFSHPIEIHLHQKVAIKQVVTKKRVRLRLPASVRKKVGDAHKEKKKKQSKQVRALLKQSQGKLRNACWQWPLESKIVSKFGSARTLANGDKYFHTGVDLRARVPTPIRATSAGRVLYADHMILPGNHIMLDHGGGLITRYFHLSRFKVKAGDQVTSGQVIGLSGATGRVEGPHLHWETIWRGSRVNPDSLLRALGRPCDQG